MTADHLLEDCREFLATEKWYVERGIPYRRGYLLHGIKGTGKSSLVVAIASELGLPIYMMHLSYEMTDETLVRLLQERAHPPSVLLHRGKSDYRENAFCGNAADNSCCLT